MLLWVGIGAVVLLFLLIAAGASYDDSPEAQVARIKESCEREYGVDTHDSRSCQIAIMTAKLKQQEDDKLRRAADRAGL